MVRDAVANIVIRLQECGFDPRKIGARRVGVSLPGAQKRGLRSFDHPQRAQSCRARVPECGELPALSNRRGTRFDERSCV